MSDQSNFKDEEIERERRAATSRRKNVDYAKIREQRDLLLAARICTPEEFQARMKEYEVDFSSERGKTIMEAYWAIRRGLQR
jgi:hypothetical protein